MFVLNSELIIEIKGIINDFRGALPVKLVQFSCDGCDGCLGCAGGA